MGAVKKLLWKKIPLKNYYEVYDGDHIVGELVWPSTLRFTAKGIFNKRQFEISKKGWFRPKFHVLDVQSQELIDTFGVYFWKDKGKVLTRPGEDIIWDYTDFWENSWAWKNGSQVEIKYKVQNKGIQEQGVIYVHERFNENDGYRILLGLYIRDYFTRS